MVLFPILADSGVLQKETKEFHVDLLDSGKNPNRSSNRENNCVYLVCPIYYYVYGQPTQIKEDGDHYTSQGGQPTGAQFAHKHTLMA